MTRSSMLIGASLLAAVSMMALSAPLVLAEQPAQLVAEAGVVTLDGSQPESQVQVFTRSGKQVFCEIATLDVSATSGAETLTASPVYEECTMLGVGPATVKMNECDLGLNLTREGSNFSAISSISCPEGKQIEILAYVSEAKHSSGTTVCEYTLGSQSGLEAMDLTNKAASEGTPASWILAHLEIGKLTSKSLKNELICGASSDATGTLEGEVEIKGTDSEGEPTDIAIAKPLPGPAGLTTEGGVTATVTVEQEGVNVLTRGARSWTCQSSSMVGEASNEVQEVTLTPSYEKCHTNIGASATLTMNGCDYTLEFLAETGSPEDTWMAKTSLHCPPGQDVVLHAYLNEAQHTSTPTEPSCQYTFTDRNTEGEAAKTNQDLGALVLTNIKASEGTPKDWILMHLNLGGIHSKRTRGSALLCGPETHETAELHGTASIKANQFGEQLGITMST